MEPMQLQVPPLELSGDGTSDGIPDTSNTSRPVNDDSIANPFLNGIPEQDRAIVAKYVKDWDSNVTKRFQSIHEQYQPYKDLGDVESIQRAMDIINLLENDPHTFAENLANVLSQLGEDDEEFDEDNDMSDDYQLSGDQEPDELSELKTTVQSLAQTIEQERQARQEAADMEELDNYIKQLHTTHGDFDDDYVLVQMSRGLDPEKAIEKYNSMIEEKINSRRKSTPPPLISGQGGVQSGQVDPSKLSSADRKAYVAAMLQAGRD